MQDASIQPVMLKVFLGISVGFLLFSLVADAVFIAIPDVVLDRVYVLEFPFVGSLVGVMSGVIAKTIRGSDETSPEQGCAVNTLILLNLAVFVVNIFSLCVLAYFLSYVD
jgi:hypothetical protein